MGFRARCLGYRAEECWVSDFGISCFGVRVWLYAIGEPMSSERDGIELTLATGDGADGMRLGESWFGIWCLGFRVWSLGFGVLGSGFGVWGLGSGVWGFRFGVLGLGA